MDITITPPQLQQVKDRLNNGEDFVQSTPRELLSWFGQFRRTWRQVKKVRESLGSLELQTVPDFEGSGFDETVLIRKQPPPPASTGTTQTTTAAPSLNQEDLSHEENGDTGHPIVDPVHRVSRFLTAGPLVGVTRDEGIQVAVTKMMMHDYSQLPVMQSEMKVNGMISWKSIGQKVAVGNDPKFVRDCIEPHNEVKADVSIFDAIRVIQEHDCVLVRSNENKITGILTAADISGSFEQLSRPFLLLSYVENHLRALIAPRFTSMELQSAKDPSDTDRIIKDVADMTFGEYVRLLENPENWSKLCINIERSLFVAQLNDVREIRNDVMHFNPEGIEDADMIKLKKFSSFLESLVSQMPKQGVK